MPSGIAEKKAVQNIKYQPNLTRAGQNPRSNSTDLGCPYDQAIAFGEPAMQKRTDSTPAIKTRKESLPPQRMHFKDETSS